MQVTATLKELVEHSDVVRLHHEDKTHPVQYSVCESNLVWFHALNTVFIVYPDQVVSLDSNGRAQINAFDNMTSKHQMLTAEFLKARPLTFDDMLR